MVSGWFRTKCHLSKSKETFNLGDDKVGSAFGSYFIKNGMSGNARMLQEEMSQSVRETKMNPRVLSVFDMASFFAAAEVMTLPGKVYPECCTLICHI